MLYDAQPPASHFNAHNDAPVEMPFGGSKIANVGRESAKAAIKYYSQLKSIFVRMNGVEKLFLCVAGDR